MKEKRNDKKQRQTIAPQGNTATMRWQQKWSINSHSKMVIAINKKIKFIRRYKFSRLHPIRIQPTRRTYFIILINEIIYIVIIPYFIALKRNIFHLFNFILNKSYGVFSPNRTINLIYSIL